MGDPWLGSSSMEEGPGVLVDRRPRESAVPCSCTEGRCGFGVHHRCKMRVVIVPLCLASGYYVRLWALHFPKDVEKLETV